MTRSRANRMKPSTLIQRSQSNEGGLGRARADADEGTSPVMKVPEAARLFGVGETAVREAIRRKQLPVIFVGRKVLLPRAAILKMLQDGQPIGISGADR